jgi:hypothetical protein
MSTDHALEASDSSDRSRRGAPLVALATIVLGVGATAGWVIAAALMTTRGFDITDEGFYVLSYRWWSSNLHAFTGAQYIYGPVFDAVGHNVAALRMFRLGTVLVVATFFAIAFMNWLAAHEPRTRPLRWRVAGSAAIVASAGLIYGWLPNSPGYDDVAALGGLATAAVLLATARRWHLFGAVPAWLPVAGGLLATIQMLAKWSSALNVVAFGFAVLLVLAGSGWRPLIRYAGLVLAGAVGTAAFFHVFVVRLDRALPEMWFVNRRAAEESGSLSSRAFGYLTDLADIGEHALQPGLLIMIVALAARLAGSRRLTLTWAGVIVAAFGVFWLDATSRHGWQGGPSNVRGYTSTLIALVLASALAGIQVRRPPVSQLGPLLMLTVIPLSQAFGTSNPIWMVAGNAFAAWFALLVWLVATNTRRPTAGLVGWLGGASVVVLVTLIAGTGMLLHPYRTTPYSEDTASVPGLASVRVSPAAARQYAAVRHALSPHLEGGKAPVFALDRMSGLVFIAGGTAAGEPWNGTELRSGAVLKRACEQGEVGPDHPPIVLLNRSVAKPDIKALGACGFVFPGDFTEVPVRNGPPAVRLYVPR